MWLTITTFGQDAKRVSWHFAHRDWEDIPEYPDYDEIITFEDQGFEGRPTSKVVEVSKETELLVKGACTKRLSNNTRLQIRNTFPLPQVAASRTPQLDSFIKPKVPQSSKTADKELA